MTRHMSFSRELEDRELCEIIITYFYLPVAIANKVAQMQYEDLPNPRPIQII